MIHQYISEEFAYALGWTLVHSLWQALAIGLLLFVLLHFTRKKSATTRYWMSNFALFGVLAAAIFTFKQLYKSSLHPIQELTYQAGETLFIIQHQIEESPVNLLQGVHHWLDFFDTHINFVSSFWFIGLLFFAIRLLFSFVEVRLLRSQSQPLENAFWMDKMQAISTRLGIQKAIPLLESAHTNMPMVLGYFKPIVLLPIGTINALAPEQVEAILAHELAHIARHDYLFNILQSIIEMLFFFNPVVWWMSTNIRTERENCCDDLALDICKDSLTYAKSLVHLQELQNRPTPQLAMALFGTKKQLLQRVQRILNHPQSKSSIMEKLAATCLLLVALCFYSATGIFQAETEAPIETTHSLEHFAFLDTLPDRRGTSNIQIKDNDKDVSVKIKNGVIKSLKIDGKAIPEEELESYEGYVEELLEELPVPPAPPVPPMPPAPPVSPNIDGIVPPPPPPTAPVAPASPSFRKNATRIEKRIDEDGNTFLHIDRKDGKPPVTIRIEESDELSVEGEMMIEKTKKEGERIILLKEGVFKLNGKTIVKEDDSSSFNFNEDEGIFQFYSDEDATLFAANDFDFNIEMPEIESLFSNTLSDFEVFQFDLDTLPQLDEERMEALQERLAYAQERMQAVQERFHEEHEERMEAVHERLAAAQERMHASREEQHEKMEALQERLQEMEHKKMEIIHEKMEREHEKMEMLHERIEREHEARERQSDEFKKTIQNSLLEDGLIKNASKYRFELTHNSLKVDGKEQSKAMAKKYKALVESLSDHKIGLRDEVKMKVNGSNTSTSVSYH